MHTPIPTRVDAVGTTTSDLPLGHWSPYTLRPDVSFMPVYRTTTEDYNKRRLPYKVHVLPRFARQIPVITRRDSCIYTHNVEFTLPFLAIPKHRRPRIVMASHGHGGHTSLYSGHLFRFGWFKRLYWRCEALALREVDALILVSREGQDWYSQRFPQLQHKFHRIDNGVDVNHFTARNKQEARAKLGIPQGVPVIASVGRLSPQKDLRLSLETFARLQAVFPTAQLVIAGDGPEQDRVEGIIREQRMGGIKRLGNIGSSELPSVYSAADAFLLTSLWEGMPMTLLEALACEVPAVTTSVGECPDVLNHGGGAGFVARTRNADELAALLVRVVSGEYSAEACRNRALKFSAEAMANTVTQVVLGDSE